MTNEDNTEVEFHYEPVKYRYITLEDFWNYAAELMLKYGGESKIQLPQGFEIEYYGEDK